MGLYGVPAGPPTVTPAASGASGTAAGPAQPSPDQALQDAVSRLMQQLQQPQEVAPPKLSHRILASLGDGLMNYASILAGQGPVGTPSGNRLVGMQQERQSRENEKTQVRNQATVRAFEIEQTNKRAGEREAAADARARERDEAIAARQAEADKRQAEAAAIKSEAERKERVAKAWTDLLQQPGFVDWWAKVNPGQIRLDDLTDERILRITESFYKDSGFDPKTAATAAEVNTALRNATAAQQAAPPGMDLTGIQAGPYKFEKPKPRESDATVDSPATPTTRRQAARAGVWQPNMTEGAALDAISAKAEEDKLAREKRLNARTERGTKARDDIAAMYAVKENARLALAMLDKEGDIGGPVAGQFPDWAVGVKDYFSGSNDQTARVEFNRRLTKATASVRNAAAGLNMTAIEQKLLEPMLATITDTETKKRDNLMGLIEEAEKIIQDRLKRFGLTDDDMAFLERGGKEVESALPPGATVKGQVP